MLCPPRCSERCGQNLETILCTKCWLQWSHVPYWAVRKATDELVKVSSDMIGIVAMQVSQAVVKLCNVLFLIFTGQRSFFGTSHMLIDVLNLSSNTAIQASSFCLLDLLCACAAGSLGT